jgi:hypothetical protein
MIACLATIFHWRKTDFLSPPTLAFPRERTLGGLEVNKIFMASEKWVPETPDDKQWQRDDIEYNLKGTGPAQEVLEGKTAGEVEIHGDMVIVYDHTGKKITEFNGYLLKYGKEGHLPDGRYGAVPDLMVYPSEKLIDGEIKKRQDK